MIVPTFCIPNMCVSRLCKQILVTAKQAVLQRLHSFRAKFNTCKKAHCKKVSDFPCLGWDVTYQTLPRTELFNYSPPGKVWQVTSRLLGDGKTDNLFLQCMFYDPNYGRQPVALAYVVCCGDLNVLVPSLLNELRNDLFASESEILTSRDYADLVTILDELTKVEI
jgi:hypothetical protein